MELDTILARIWPGRQVAVEPLAGGITNHNFKVSLGADVYVLRIGGRNTHLLGIDRRAEYEATVAAATVGVGPEVVRFIEPEGYLVTRFVDGGPVSPAEMRRPEQLSRVASALRRVHEGVSIPARFDSFRVVEAFERSAREHGVSIPDAYAPAQATAGTIEALRGRQPLRPCHNDLLNANFIDDGRDLRIVDWEYAGMGDVFFDLANFSINHELTAVDNDLLLDAYLGAVTARDRASLRVMRFMSDFREAMWGVVQQGISELDFDFVGYAGEHFERLERTAAEPAFREALQTLGEDGAR